MKQSDFSQFAAIVLAAGKGTRLNSNGSSPKPKVLYEIGGKPMILYTLEKLNRLNLGQIITVVGYGREKVMETCGNLSDFALQDELRGTGHAALQAEGVVKPEIKHVWVMYGDDTAFYRLATWRDFLNNFLENEPSLSFVVGEPENYKICGRVILDKEKRSIRIVEKEYLNEDQKEIKVVNLGMYCFEKKWGFSSLKKLEPSKVGNGELILTDLVEIAAREGNPALSFKVEDASEWFGVNTAEELKQANEKMKREE